MQQTQNPQGYQQQNYQQEPQYYIPPRKKHNFIAVGLLLIVIIGAVGLYFAIKPKLQSAMSGTSTPDLQAATQIPKVEITALKLCNSVDENFVCTENKERVFTRGDTFYVYAEVSVTNDKLSGTEIILNKGLEITNDKGVLIYKNNNFDTVTEKIGTEKIIKVPITIPMQSSTKDTPGKEEVKITISSVKTTSATKTIGYEII